MPARNKRKSKFLILFIVLLIAVVIFQYLRPLPKLKFESTSNKIIITQTTSISWPDSQETAIGAIGYGILATHGNQTALPTASTAKLITALTVLQKYPLSLDNLNSPVITLSANDVNLYNQYLNEDGSVVKVVAGEQITEYQALEAMMLPSANNIADTLAIWAFGSLANYSIAANQYVHSIGLTNTKIGSDASGFLPSTVSTATDLTLIAEKVLSNPVLAQIVSLKEADFPVVGSIKNVNWLLGEDGIYGIKTGNTDQAGGVYVFATKYQVTSNDIINIVGTIQGAPTLQDALNSAISLINSIKANFTASNLIFEKQTIGYIRIPWGSNVNLLASQNLTLLVWGGTTLIPQINIDNLSEPITAHTVIGSVTIKSGNNAETVNLITSTQINNPPWWWRIIRHKL